MRADFTVALEKSVDQRANRPTLRTHHLLHDMDTTATLFLSALRQVLPRCLEEQTRPAAEGGGASASGEQAAG